MCITKKFISAYRIASRSKRDWNRIIHIATTSSLLSANEQVNPAGTMYIWDYGDGSKRDTVYTADGMVRHLYRAPNDYTIKLKVILAGQCFDSTTTVAKVWPGFKPNFTWRGSCVLKPIQFEDRTTTAYGVVSKWTWDFGDETTTADASTQKNPPWKYSTTGFKSVRLIVESNKGCIDTLVLSNVEVKDKPTITLAFKDTLICSDRPVQDTLQLRASGNGVFSWTPTTDMLFPLTGYSIGLSRIGPLPTGYH